METVLHPVPHGKPLRLREERQLGYKIGKYLMRMELLECFDRIDGGRGSDCAGHGYAWYAGIECRLIEEAKARVAQAALGRRWLMARAPATITSTMPSRV